MMPMTNRGYFAWIPLTAIAKFFNPHINVQILEKTWSTLSEITKQILGCPGCKDEIRRTDL